MRHMMDANSNSWSFRTRSGNHQMSVLQDRDGDSGQCFGVFCFFLGCLLSDMASIMCPLFDKLTLFDLFLSTQKVCGFGVLRDQV